MKRLTAVSLSIVLVLLAFALVACTSNSTYAITVESEDEYCVQECPTQAKAGETVQVETCIVCDADVHVSVDGVEDFGTFTGGGIYEFTMPDHDVTVHVWIVGNGLA